MRDPIKAWRRQGVDVVIIGNGNRDFAEDFRKEFEIEGKLLVDPDLHAYRAAGLRRGRREIASPQLVGNAIRALRTGARQTKVMGDPWQLGGVFVFAPGGELRFRYASVAAGDHASPDAIEAALDESAEGIEEEAPVDPWRALEIGRLRITDGRGVARLLDTLGEIDGLRTEADLVDGRASVTLTADRAHLERFDRRLDLGEVSIRAGASAAGVVVDNLRLAGGDLEFDGRGEAVLVGEVEVR